MKLFNKAKRIQYLAFDDKWFVVFGIILLSFVTDFMFSRNSFARLPFFEAVINWSVSLMFSTMNWLIIRSILIGLRKRYPSLKDNSIRIPLFFVSIVLTILVVDLMGNLVLGGIFGSQYNHPLRSKIILPIILISTMTMAIYEAIYYYIRLKNAIREEEQAKRAIVQAQLDALRNQAQPHFFFNTLNTLRDIIDQNTKEEAKEFVDRLADIYRFILESGNANLISLKDELKFSKAYIHVQRERFGENLNVDWKVSKETEVQFIIPMSLQLLLENAVKHNIVSRAKPLNIQVVAKSGELSVSNPLQPKSTKLPSTKLGLKNIQERYQLISDEKVHIHKTEEEFAVTLPLFNPNHLKQNDANINN
ncbi:MAG: histidine kinase [Bacteroidota bacterium]